MLHQVPEFQYSFLVSWEDQGGVAFNSLGCPMCNDLKVEIHLLPPPGLEDLFRHHQQESNSIVMMWVGIELDDVLLFLFKMGHFFLKYDAE